jgi:hypothetical protein
MSNSYGIRAAEGIMAGAITSACALAGLAWSLNGLFRPRHGIFLGEVIALLGAPYVGAGLARFLLPASGRVSIVVLGTGTLLGLLVGMRTRPYPFVWGPEEVARSNAIWVALVVAVTGCAVGVVSRLWVSMRRG